MTLTVITISGKRLAYMASRGGKMLRDPNRLERFVVHVVNRLLCAILGHDTILRGIPECLDDDGTYPCTACCARLRP